MYGIVDYELLTNRHAQITMPAFRMQQQLRKSVLGEDYWERKEALFRANADAYAEQLARYPFITYCVTSLGVMLILIFNHS
jgi:hypothetical protein